MKIKKIIYFKKLCWGVAMSLMFLVLSNQCRKEEKSFPVEKTFYASISEKSLIQLKGRNNETVSQAKAWLQNAFPQTRSSNDWRLLWEYAFTDSLNNSETVEIPIAYLKQTCTILPECMQMYEETKDKRYLQNITRFIVEKNDSTQQTRAYFMTIVPTMKYLEETDFQINLNTYLQRDHEFDGYIMFYDTEGSLVNGWKYVDGEVASEVSPAQSATTTRASQEVCLYEIIRTYTDWYVNGVYDHTTLNDVEVNKLECWIDSEGGVTSGGSSGSYAGSSGDSDSFSDDIDSPEVDKPGLEFEDDVYGTEEIIIDDSFKDTKTECIYNEISKLSTGFNDILRRFDGSFSVAHLKLMINNNLNSSVFGATYPPQNYVIKIEFNDSSIGQISDLGKAITMIHEMIHAEMYRKLLSAVQKGDLNHDNYTAVEMENYVNSMRNNFPGLYDYYWKRYHPEWGHDMMASHYRDIITNVLQQVDNNRLDKSIYEALSWAGLGEFENGQSTVAWQKLSESEKQNIKNVISNYFFSGLSKCN